MACLDSLMKRNCALGVAVAERGVSRSGVRPTSREVVQTAVMVVVEGMCI